MQCTDSSPTEGQTAHSVYNGRTSSNLEERPGSLIPSSRGRTCE